MRIILFIYCLFAYPQFTTMQNVDIFHIDKSEAPIPINQYCLSSYSENCTGSNAYLFKEIAKIYNDRDVYFDFLSEVLTKDYIAIEQPSQYFKSECSIANPQSENSLQSLYNNQKSSLNIYEQRNFDKYISIEQCFLSGEYEKCSALGDSLWLAIDNISNIYEAFALTYSAMANHSLMFAEKTNSKDNISYIRNYHKQVSKAKDAVHYFEDISIERDTAESNSSYLINLLNSYNIIYECYKLASVSTSELLFEIHKNLWLQKDSLELHVSSKLQLILFEILYSIKIKEFDTIINTLVPQFEKYCSLSYTEDIIERRHIASLYHSLSEILNACAVEHCLESTLPVHNLKELSLNTIINSYEYSRFIQKEQTAIFPIHVWQDYKTKIKDNELIVVFYTYSNGTDSWNYGWTFDSQTNDIGTLYGGHSYQTTTQATEFLESDKYQKYKRFWILGTNQMSFIDFINDPRCVRTMSLSNIDTYSEYNDIASVSRIVAIGNIQYNISTDLHFVEPLQGEKEIFQLSKLFGSKLKIVEKDKFRKSTLTNIDAPILHISTHGKFDIDLLDSLNRIDPIKGMIGDNIMRSCGLMLSGYNDSPQDNFLSAMDIKTILLQNIDLVFLSACQSASGRSLPNGNYSLVEAFHLAGAKKILAIIDDIQDNVATRFSFVFYSLLLEGESIHNAFYKAKGQVCPYSHILLYE